MKPFNIMLVYNKMPTKKRRVKKTTDKSVKQHVKQSVVVNVNTGSHKSTQSKKKRRTTTVQSFTKGTSYMGSMPLRMNFPSIQNNIQQPDAMFASSITNRVSALENIRMSQMADLQQSQGMIAPITQDTPKVATPMTSPIDLSTPKATIQNPTYEDLSPPNSVADYSVYDTPMPKKQLSYDDNPDTMSFKPPQVPFSNSQRLSSEIEASPEPVESEIQPASPMKTRQQQKQFKPKGRLLERATYMEMDINELNAIRTKLENETGNLGRGRPPTKKSTIVNRIMTLQDIVPKK
jgi:hypothetical protein